MRSSFLFFVIFLLARCNNKSNNPEETEAESKLKIQAPIVSCYSYITNKDTINLRIEKFPNAIRGNLNYIFFEKDRNKGIISGVLKGDTLVADYTFLSEGKSSVRQVIFLITDSLVIEGHGQMEEKEEKMVFKDVSTVDFTNGTKLKRYPCSTD